MTDAATFWEDHYSKTTKPSGGWSSAILVRLSEGRTPGWALDLGCARGDDAIWLAGKGWTVTGVDVAETALTAARDAAGKAGVGHQTTLEHHDLAVCMPVGSFDRISAMFLHTPVAFDRVAVLRRAANAVAPGGLFLLGAHGSRAPWSLADPDTNYPTTHDELNSLNLDEADWRHLLVGPIEREANGPDGQTACVIDTVVAIERR